jgi:transposase
MAKDQENGITILLGLEGYHVGWVREGNEGIVVEVGIRVERTSCPNCGSMGSYRHGSCKLRYKGFAHGGGISPPSLDY